MRMGEPQPRPRRAGVVRQVVLGAQPVERVALRVRQAGLDRLAVGPAIQPVDGQDLRQRALELAGPVLRADAVLEPGRERFDPRPRLPFEEQLHQQHVLVAGGRRFLAGALPIPAAQLRDVRGRLVGQGLDVDGQPVGHLVAQVLGLLRRTAADDQRHGRGIAGLADRVQLVQRPAPHAQRVALVRRGMGIVDADEHAPSGPGQLAGPSDRVGQLLGAAREEDAHAALLVQPGQQGEQHHALAGARAPADPEHRQAQRLVVVGDVRVDPFRGPGRDALRQLGARREVAVAQVLGRGLLAGQHPARHDALGGTVGRGPCGDAGRARAARRLHAVQVVPDPQRRLAEGVLPDERGGQQFALPAPAHRQRPFRQQLVGEQGQQLALRVVVDLRDQALLEGDQRGIGERQAVRRPAVDRALHRLQLRLGREDPELELGQQVRRVGHRDPVDAEEIAERVGHRPGTLRVLQLAHDQDAIGLALGQIAQQLTEGLRPAIQAESRFQPASHAGQQHMLELEREARQRVFAPGRFLRVLLAPGRGQTLKIDKTHRPIVRTTARSP